MLEGAFFIFEGICYPPVTFLWSLRQAQASFCSRSSVIVICKAPTFSWTFSYIPFLFITAFVLPSLCSSIMFVYKKDVM